MNCNEIISLNIQKLISENKITKEQIIDNLNIEDIEYNLLLANKYHLTVPQLNIICNLANCSFISLFDEENVKNMHLISIADLKAQKYLKRKRNEKVNFPSK